MDRSFAVPLCLPADAVSVPRPAPLGRAREAARQAHLDEREARAAELEGQLLPAAKQALRDAPPGRAKGEAMQQIRLLAAELEDLEAYLAPLLASKRAAAAAAAEEEAAREAREAAVRAEAEAAEAARRKADDAAAKEALWEEELVEQERRCEQLTAQLAAAEAALQAATAGREKGRALKTLRETRFALQQLEVRGPSPRFLGRRAARCCLRGRR